MLTDRSDLDGSARFVLSQHIAKVWDFEWLIDYFDIVIFSEL